MKKQKSRVLLIAAALVVAAIGILANRQKQARHTFTDVAPPPAGHPTLTADHPNQEQQSIATQPSEPATGNAASGNTLAAVPTQSSPPPTVPSFKILTNKDLPPDFLDRIVSENTVAFTLPDGREATGNVDMIQRDAHGVQFVQGRLTQPAAGFYFFQRQTDPGMAGPLVGNVRFDGKEDGWKIEPSKDLAASRFVAREMDAIICKSDPKAPEAGAEDPERAPEDHPANTNSTDIPAYQNGVVSLQSLPGATGVLYLDFDGEKGPFPSWGNFDAAHSGLNNAQIRDTWVHVAEDFAPFNLNVTTDLQVFLAAPATSRQRCIISPSSPVGSGVAYVGSFNWSGDVVCWAGYRGSNVGHEVVSHELGHTLGLSHDGRTDPAEGYYAGQGPSPVGWAPIMGNSYYKDVSQWSKGEYTNANQLQDDLLIITENNNLVNYRTDDHGDSYAVATYLEIFPGNSVSNEGVIETRADYDGFRFTTSASGTVSLAVNPAVHSPNLDILAELVDSSGVVIASDNPDLGLAATVSAANLPAGEYFLRVSGVGRGDPAVDGYSDYASLGCYKVTGSVPNAILPDRLSIAENSPNGAAVGTVPPRNNHGTSPLTYAIASGNTNDAFAINPVTGVITVANSAALDYETVSQNWDDPAEFELFVTITDGNTPALNENLRTVITLNDVNETHSIVGNAAAQVFCNAKAGTLVASFWTQGEDQFDHITWSISSGNTGNAFTITTDGKLTVASSTALAEQNSYTLQITATDYGPSLPIISASHTITVNTLLWNPGDSLAVRNWTQEPGVSASQSTTAYGGVASRAIDGNTNGAWSAGSVTHTDTFANSWWEVNLGTERKIGAVQLFNRTDSNGARLSNFRISILDISHTEIAGQDYYVGSGSAGASELWTLSSAVEGSYVRVQLLGNNNTGNGYLSLAEVVVLEALPDNVALGGLDWTRQSGVTASQSSTYSTAVASLAIDGNTDGVYNNGSVTHTNNLLNSWWEVDLGADRSIGSVNLFNRADGVGSRLSNFRLSVLDAARVEVAGQNFYQGTGSVGTSEQWVIPSPVTGRYVRIQILGYNNDGNGFLSLAEVQVYEDGPLATQSTTDWGGVASRAIDGNTDGVWSNGSITHTDGSSNGWWQVNLGALQSIEQIVLYNRSEVPKRLSNFKVSIWNGDSEVYSSNHFTEPGTSASMVFSLSQIGGMIADRVRIELLGNNNNGDKVLSLAEVKVLGTPYVNSAPVANNATFSVAENSVTATHVGTVIATDGDADDVLSYAITAGNADGKFTINSSTGAITTAADLNYEATAQYTLAITVTDNANPALSDTAAVTVNVTNVNEAPVFDSLVDANATEDTAFSGSLASAASDVDDGDSLTFSKVSGPAWLSIASNGTLSGTPLNDHVGANDFVIRVTDAAGASADSAWLITVINVNDAPIFTVDPINLVTTEDSIFADQLVATDADTGDSLSFSKVSGPSWLTVSSLGALSGTPGNSNVGANAFIVRVTDAAGAFSNATLNISVTNVNDAPVFTVDPIIAANATEGTAYSGETITGLATDIDAGDTISYSKVSGPTWLTVSSNGTLAGTPSTGSAGLNTFVVRATDSSGATDDAQLQITVTGLPLPWSSTDIGTGMLAGSVAYNAGVFTQSGSGSLSGTSDQLRFTYQSLTGDGEIIARISSLQNTGNSSSVGVMIRESLAANSRMAFMGLSGSGNYRWLRRTSTGAKISSSNSSSGTVPNTWVRLTRTGNTISAYKSSNGTSWTSVGNVSISMATNCYFGFNVSSGNTTTINTSQFSNVSATP